MKGLWAGLQVHWNSTKILSNENLKLFTKFDTENLISFMLLKQQWTDVVYNDIEISILWSIFDIIEWLGVKT